MQVYERRKTGNVNYQGMVGETIEVIKDIYPLGLCGCSEDELLIKVKEIKEANKHLNQSDSNRVLIKEISKYKAEMKKSKVKKPSIT